MEDRGLLNKITDEVELDRSVVKLIILAVIGIISVFVFGYFLNLFIIDGQWNFLLISFLAALVFLAIFLLEVFFIKASWIVNLVVFLQTLAVLAPFYDHLSKIVIIVALISFLLFLSGIYVGRAELDNMLKIKFWRISKKTLPKAITALALLSSIFYVEASSLSQKQFFISPATFEKSIGFIPIFDFSTPADKLIRDLAIKQTEANPQFKLLPESMKNKIIEQSVKDLEKQISDITGVSLNSQTKTSEVIYRFLIEKYNQLPENIKPYTPLVMALIIFLIIISLSWPIRLIATTLAFLIYEICLALGFSTIIMEGRSREIIILK